MAWPLWKTVWQFLKMLKVELPYDPGFPCLGIYILRRNENTCSHKNLSMNIDSTILLNSQKEETTQKFIN